MRLKGGDPFVFGRGARRPKRCAAAGIPFEVVPGITSADRRAGVRGHPGDAPGRVDPLHRRDRPRGSGQGPHRRRLGGARPRRGHARDPHGRGPDRRHRPAASSTAGARPTRPSPRSATGPVPTSGRSGRRSRPSPTPGCGPRARSWSATSPRSISPGSSRGRCSVARSSSPAHASRRVSCARAGGARRRGDRAARHRDRAPSTSRCPTSPGTRGWCSRRRTASTRFFERGLDPAGLDARALAGVQVAAIGPGTARALLAHGIRADLVPERFVAESLLAAFPPPAHPGERVLLARAEQARDVLPEGLGDRGLHRRRARGVPHRARHARRRGARAGARRRRRRGDVHVVVDRRQLLRRARPLPDPQPARRVDRTGHVGDRRRPRPAGRRRGRPSTPSTASSPPSSTVSGRRYHRSR